MAQRYKLTQEEAGYDYKNGANKMPAETIEGTVTNADETSFQLDAGRYYKYSKKVKPAHVAYGERVRVTFSPSEWEGKTYYWVSKTERLSAPTAPNGQGPLRDDGIAWANALNGAVACLVANQSWLAAKGVPVTAATVLSFARDLYDARPWAEPPEPEVMREPAEPVP